MRVLGISELDSDAGAVLFVDGQLVAAASEERFTRRKLQPGFPARAVDWMLGRARLQPRELDAVVIVSAEPADDRRAIAASLAAYDWRHAPGPWPRRWLNWAAFRAFKAPRRALEARRLGRQVQGWLDGNAVPRQRVVRAHHHRSHAAAAFFASGFDHGLAVTCDGQGGGVTASVYRGHGASLSLVHEVRMPDSMGFFYAMVTRGLGLRPVRDEGKVTGLAAYRPPDPDALGLFRDLARPAGQGFITPGVYGALPEVLRLARARGKAEVAAAAQQVLEEVVTGYVAHHLAASGEVNVALAGGVFANVKLNQRVREIAGVERVFVFPHMGDGGLGYGGVVDLLAELEGRKSVALGDVYWGPEYSEADLEGALLQAGLEYKFVPEVERRVGQRLARGKSVARFAGRMEFGPRALGNRSILCPATDRTVNDWLNRKLRRTEFMPFAPVVLAEDAPHLFRGLAGAESAAQFMTMTFACTEAMRTMAPAVVHVDGTARPQVLHEAVNPGYYAVLDEYRRETGLPALINTSFNLHEEPIVMSPGDAIRAFLEAGLDLLALGPFLCERPG